MRSTSCFLLAAFAASVAFSSDASAQCSTGGPGGSFPVPGSVTGTWDASLPTGPLVSTLAVSVPPGATVLNSVRLNGLTHSWGGDCHVVLESPTLQQYNILVRSDSTSPTGGGCSDPFAGNYVIVDPLTGGTCAGNPPMGCSAIT